jgi:hypothetical protein
MKSLPLPGSHPPPKSQPNPTRLESLISPPPQPPPRVQPGDHDSIPLPSTVPPQVQRTMVHHGGASLHLGESVGSISSGNCGLVGLPLPQSGLPQSHSPSRRPCRRRHRLRRPPHQRPGSSASDEQLDLGVCR